MALDYNDIICQAIDTIVSKRLENLDYDKTIKATIVDDSDAKTGHYVVNDGSIDFDAYSEDTDYVNNENVYVTVPKGDFTQTKIIISKYTKNNGQDPIVYSSPLDSIYLISDNIAAGGVLVNNSILANGRTEQTENDRINSIIPPGQSRVIWEQNLLNIDDYTIQNNGIFDRLAVKADFSCALGNSYQMREGNYGIYLEINSVVDNGTANSGLTTQFILDTLDMVGDPYAYLSYVGQTKVFDISSLGNITNIKVMLYQLGNFKYQSYEDNKIYMVPSPWGKDDQGNDKYQEDDRLNNIFVDNLEIYFGIDMANISDNTFKIYTNSSLTFDPIAAQNDELVNQKIIVPIWFNKTEDNEYIGFSDGVYDYLDSTTEPIGKEYDEDDYMKLSAYYQRISTLSELELNEMGIPSMVGLLQTYAIGQSIQKKLSNLNIKLGTNLSQSISQLVVDLKDNQSTLQYINSQNCRDYILSLGENSDTAYKDTINYINNITKNSDEDDEYFTFMEKIIEILQRYGKIYRHEDGAEIGTTVTNDEYEKILYYIDNNSNEIDSLQEFFDNLRERVLEDFFGTGTYGIRAYAPDGLSIIVDSWEESITKLLDSCQEQIDEIKEQIDLEGIEERFDNPTEEDKATIRYNLYISYNQLSNNIFYDYNEEYQNFINGYSNRYCIYWYRYAGDSAGVDDELSTDIYMPTGWQKIAGLNNFGLPDGYHEDESTGNYYFDERPIDPRVFITVGNPTLNQEQIQAILFYNHAVYKSNILTFVNERPTVDDDTSPEAKGLYIQLTNQVVNEKGQIISQDTYYSKETYQLYGVTNHLVNTSEAFKKRTLRARYKTANKSDEYLKNDCIIYWFVPLHGTMLTYNRDELIAAGFSVYDPTYMRMESDLAADIQAIQIPTKEEYEASEESQQEDSLDYDTWVNLWFDAAVEDLKNRMIGTPYPIPASPYGDQYREGYAMFWKNTASIADGDKTVLDVTSTEFNYYIKEYYVPSFTNNTIECRIVKKNMYTADAEQYFTFASYGTNGTDYSLCIVPATRQAVLLDDNPLQLKVQVFDVNGNVLEEETAKTKISWEQNFGGVIVTGTAPDVYVKKIPDFQYFYAVLKAETTITIQSYSEGEVDIVGHEDSNASDVYRSSRQVTLIAYYPVPYASNDYYLEGPTTVVYNSLGTEPNYYEGPYEIYKGQSFGSQSDTAVNGSSLRHQMIYSHRDRTTDETTSGLNAPSTFVKEALPKLKQIQSASNTFGNYELQLSVPSMYIDTTYYSSIVFDIPSENQSGIVGDVVFVQPIWVQKNRYSSAMLNDWDGELTIDKKNGTILASMMGAGKKEEDNTFSGVLMGTVSDTSGDTAAGNMGSTGVYGYNHGEQSFGLKDDGTAFFGKSGRGRIEIDGNHGQIASSSYYNKQNELDGVQLGMMIDLDDGYIDMRGGYLDSTNDNATSWVMNNPETWNNNEQNGYNNLSKYRPTGSQVNISVKSPFFVIKSPSMYYYKTAYDNIDDLREGSIQEFWNGITYYSDSPTQEHPELPLLVSYLNDSWGFYNSEKYFCSTATIVADSVDNISDDANSYLPSVYPYFIKVEDDIDTSNASESFLEKFTEFVETENIIIPTGEDVETVDGDEGQEEIVPQVILCAGDYVLVNSANEYIRYPKENGQDIENYPSAAINNQQTIDDIKCIVHASGKAVQPFEHLYSYKIGEEIENINIEYDVTGYSTVEDLANAIYNCAIVDYPQDEQDLVNLKSVLDSNLKFNYLSSDDRNLGYDIYLKNLGEEDLYGVKESKILMKVGIDSYFLQTDNYNKDTVYNSFKNGKGLKFDLMKGTLDAYNFKLSAADPIEGSYVSLSSDGNPFFRVAYSGKNRNPNIIAQDEQDKKKYINLIDITKNNFIMQSQNWYNSGDVDDRSGTRIDMVKGKIESYNFNLISYNTNEPNVGSYLKLSSSGNSWIQIHYVDTTEDEEKNLDLLNISKKTFLMQSQDWVEEKNDVRGSGTQINLSKGTIKSYNFNLKAQNNSGSEYDGSYLQMRSNGNPYLLIHHKYTDSEDESKNLDKDILKISNNEYFLQSVNYSIVSGSESGTRLDLNTGNFTSYSGTLTYGTAILSSTIFSKTFYDLVDGNQVNRNWPSQGWRFVIGDGFGVTDAGVLYASGGNFSGTINATSGHIGGWHINGNNLVSDTNNVILNGSDGSISSSAISGGSITGGSITAGYGNGGGGGITVYGPGGTVVFSANASGLTINGSGTFSGALSAASGTFSGSLTGGTIYIPDGNNPKFMVNGNGEMTATAGTIGPFTIGVNTDNNPILKGGGVTLDSYNITCTRLYAGDVTTSSISIPDTISTFKINGVTRDTFYIGIATLSQCIADYCSGNYVPATSMDKREVVINGATIKYWGW